MGLSVALLSSLIPQFIFYALASPLDHIYNEGDQVPLYVNKVGPLRNPSETYQYYELPFCISDKVTPKKLSLGEVLSGDRLSESLYDLRFKLNKPETVLCRKKLSRNEIAKFKDAIATDHYFQMYYDDLPLWGFIGKVENNGGDSGRTGPTFYLFKHVNFNILYNNNQIIEIHAFCDPNVSEDITNPVELEIPFTYSVSWNKTSTVFQDRMNRYSKASLLPVHQKIHWFSFVNSVVIVILLTGYVSFLFLQNLGKDFRRHPSGDEEEDREVGWRYLHNDVFACPPNIHLFSAVLGSGTQLLILTLVLFLFSFMGILYPFSRGALATSVVLVYTITSVVAGYISASYYCQFAETGLVKCVLLAGMIFLVPFLFIVFILNLVAAYLGTTAALPFGTIMVVIVVYTLFGLPVLALGGLLGYTFRSDFSASYSEKRPREIASSSWYQRGPGQMFIGGLLPFSVIVLELHQLYASIWGYKIYAFPGILFITFTILIMVTALLSVALTYFQLTVEDPEWSWRSVLRGGSVAIFMFLYSIYFYSKSNMNGFLQTAFYFGYNAVMCYSFFLMLGTVSFYSSLTFVRRIYRTVKSE